MATTKKPARSRRLRWVRVPDAKAERDWARGEQELEKRARRGDEEARELLRLRNPGQRPVLPLFQDPPERRIEELDSARLAGALRAHDSVRRHRALSARESGRTSGTARRARYGDLVDRWRATKRNKAALAVLARNYGVTARHLRRLLLGAGEIPKGHRL